MIQEGREPDTVSKNQQPKAPESTKLNVRGLSLRDHWKHEFPKLVKKLKAEGKDLEFFLKTQQEYEDTERHLELQDLPPGGAREILSGMYYPVDETPGRLDSPIMH